MSFSCFGLGPLSTPNFAARFFGGILTGGVVTASSGGSNKGSIFSAFTAAAFTSTLFWEDFGVAAGGFLLAGVRPPRKKNALPCVMSTKSSLSSFFCFFRFDSRSGFGGLQRLEIRSASRTSLQRSRTSLWGSIDAGHGLGSILWSFFAGTEISIDYSQILLSVTKIIYS